MPSEKGMYSDNYEAKVDLNFEDLFVESMFEAISSMSDEEKLDLIRKAYVEMNQKQRRHVFDELILDLKSRDADKDNNLLRMIEQFKKDSLNGVYYAPFNINSKNFDHVPEETDEWFDIVGEFLNTATELVKQGKYDLACKAFTQTYEVIDLLGSAEVVFADEYGTWMIPVDETECLNAYMKALSVTTTDNQDFVRIACEMIRYDKCNSFSGKVYSALQEHASKDQMAVLDQEIERLGLDVRGC